MNYTAYSARIPRRQGGFTLLEVIFAMGILAIGLLAVAALLPVAAIQQKRALDDQLGTAFGLSAAAALKAGGRSAMYFTSIVDTPTATTGDYSGASSTFAPTPKAAYKITDPANVFDYAVTYRMDATGGPISFSINVFRISPTPTLPASPVLTPAYTFNPQVVKSPLVVVKDDTVNNRTIIYGTSSGSPGPSPNTTYADVFRKNQMLMIQSGTGTTSTYYIAKVTASDESTGGNAYVSPAIGAFSGATTVSVYCCTDFGLSQNSPAGFGSTYHTATKAIAIIQGVIP